MDIDIRAPRVEKAVRPRRAGQPYRDYSSLMTKLKDKPGLWLAVDLTSLAGDSNALKQKAVLQAAKVRSMRIQTTVQDGELFVRLLSIQRLSNG